MRRVSCGLQRAPVICVAREQAPLRWLSLGRWKNRRACRARAPCCAGCDRSTRYERVLHRREASLFRRKTVVRRASCDLQHAAGIRVARAQAPLRWVSLGRWRNTRACRARAPCCAGCDRPLRYRRALHRREASLFWCKSVVRRASCDLQHAAGIRVASAQAPLRWLSLESRRNTQGLAVRAPCRAACDRPSTIEVYCTGGRLLSFGARPWYDVRAVASNAHPAFAWHANNRHCAGCLSGDSETRQIAARTRRAALVVVGLRTMEWYFTGGRPLSFGARP